MSYIYNEQDPFANIPKDLEKLHQLVKEGTFDDDSNYNTWRDFVCLTLPKEVQDWEEEVFETFAKL